MIRNSKRSLPESKSLMNIDAKIHNRFDIEVVDAKTGKIKQTARAFNVICNSYWATHLGTTWFKYIQYGSGSGTPSASDTQLFSYSGASAAGEIAITRDRPNGIVSVRSHIQLAETTAVGVAITEVGIAAGTAASTLVTHAMLQDMNGNQISILKTNTDIINIYATVFVHIGTTPHVLMFGPKYDIPIYATAIESVVRYMVGTSTVYEYNFTVRGENSVMATSPNGAGYFTINRTNKTLSWTSARYSAGLGNDTGGIIYGVAWGIIFRFSDPWYSADPIVGEAIGTGNGVKTDFATAFYGCKNATVYVNGVAQTSGVTILENQPTALSWEKSLVPFFTGCSTEGTRTADLTRADYIEIPDQSTGTMYMENLLHDTVPVDSFTKPSGNLYGSNDLQTWSEALSGVAGSGCGYRYYKFNYNRGSRPQLIPKAVASVNLTNVRFDAPPADGSTITIDYTPKCIAKDANHVLDFSLTIQLGEYTP